jgi:hypothetical protein
MDTCAKVPLPTSSAFCRSYSFLKYEDLIFINNIIENFDDFEKIGKFKFTKRSRVQRGGACFGFVGVGVGVGVPFFISFSH